MLSGIPSNNQVFLRKEIEQNEKLQGAPKTVEADEIVEDSFVYNNESTNNSTNNIVSGTTLSNFIDSFLTEYKNCYQSTFEPNTSAFTSVFNTSKNFVCNLYPAPLEVSEDEVSGDFNYAFLINTNEYLWNTNEAQNNSRNATSSASELNGKIYTGTNNTKIKVNINYTTDTQGNIIQEPANFGSKATLTITAPDGKESTITVTTDEFDVTKFEQTLNTLAETLGQLEPDVLNDFLTEIKYVDIQNMQNSPAAGFYNFNSNSISFTSNSKITPDVIAHELGHAVDDGANFTRNSNSIKEDLEKWKETAMKFYPAIVSGNYALSNVKEFFAEVYAEEFSGNSLHLSLLKKMIDKKYNEVMNNPNATAEDKALAEEVKSGLDKLINDASNIVETVREKDDSERLGSNEDYMNNKLAIQNLIKDENISQTYYALQKQGIIPKECLGVKEFILSLLDNKVTYLATIQERGAAAGGHVAELTEKLLNDINKIVAELKSQNKPQNNSSTGNSSNGGGFIGDNRDALIDTPNFNDGFNYNDDFGNNDYNPYTGNTGNTGGTTTPSNNTGNSNNGISNPNPTIGQNDTSDLKYHGSTEVNGGNINDIKDGMTLNSGNPELGTITVTPNDDMIWNAVNEQTQGMVEKTYNDLKEQFGNDANIQIQVSTNIDANGNITYKIAYNVTSGTNSNSTSSQQNSDSSGDLPNGAKTLPSGAGISWAEGAGDYYKEHYGNGDGTIDTDALTNDWINAGGTATTWTNNGDGTWSQSDWSPSGSSSGEDWSWLDFDVFSTGGGGNGNSGGFNNLEETSEQERIERERARQNARTMMQTDDRL